MIIKYKMLSQRIFAIVFMSEIPLFPVESSRVKSYHLNKYSTSDPEFDCVHTTRTRISIPRELSFCFRYKQVRNSFKWSSIFLGNIHDNWTAIDIGIEFGVWSSVPWVGLKNNGDDVWVAIGKKGGFDMLTWRHTCIAISFDDGLSMFYENGELVSEDRFDEYIQFRNKMPSSVNLITVGCVHGAYKNTHPGLVTDFQLFDRILSRQEMQDWTSCKDRLQGGVVSWDAEDWAFNRTGNASEVEYLEFEGDICDVSDESNHLFPIQTTFKKSLMLCEKVSGKLLQ